MKRIVDCLVSLAALAVLCTGGEARGQYGRGAWTAGGEGAISGNGHVVVKRPPTQVRMFLMLSGKGKTVEDAIADLKAKREKAVAHLEKLGADKKSIDPGTTAVSQEDARRRRELEMMIRQRMRGGKAAKTPKLPETVSVAAVLSARWPLEAKDPEAILVFVYKVQQQIKEAKLAGGGEKGLSDEETELAEEMGADEEMAMSRYGEEQGDPNTPMIAYVAMISEADRTKAMAEAFQKAKADAVRLAGAAGVELGPLVGVGGGDMGFSRAGYSDPFESYSSNRMQQFMMRQMESHEGETDQREAVGQNPAHVAFTVNVVATFALGKPAQAKPAQER